MSKKTKKTNKLEMNSSGKMRFLYILVLVVMIFSLFARVSGSRRATTGQTSGGTSARALVFHHTQGSLCEDLSVTAAGNAVLSNCGNGIEKQYTLNSAELAQLQSWIGTYSPVDYEPKEQPQTGASTTQLYLNGRGDQPADDAKTQQIIDFATALAAKIFSEP